MEVYNVTSYSNIIDLTTSDVDAPQQYDFMQIAMSDTIYKIGENIYKIYSPVVIPVGVIGNLLSFLVMLQPNNRKMSISLYLAALALTDSTVLITNFTYYLQSIHFVDFPPSQHWYCATQAVIMNTSSISSGLLILSMTFDRFYSIIRPHKAASFNTVKRAKIIIVCIFLFCFAYNIPYFFTVTNYGRHCVSKESQFAKSYNWVTYSLNFAFPFVALLSMNSVIIHALRTRSMLRSQGEGQNHSQGHSSRTEKHVFVILLLVTFSFLILTSPVGGLTIYVYFVDYMKTPKSFAQFYFVQIFTYQLYFTSYGINFFLYVLSGEKFRTDLMKLFRYHKSSSQTKRPADGRSTSNLSDIVTKVSNVDA